jgi:serine/threonine-protein kinase
VLGPELSDDTFLREARLVRRIAHPAVADILDTGCHDARPYLVMEHLHGAPLTALVEPRQPLARRDALDVLLELCDVLRAAHAAGIVHRDVKLDNVFVTAEPFAGGLRVKLLDWGVAHELGEPDPFRGKIAGTLTYVAPEQIVGDALTPAADVYSLAVLAFRLLCGAPPFVASSELALVHLHVRAEPPRPRELWPEIPSALDDTLVAMLAKAPGDRPSLERVGRVLRAARRHVAPARPSWRDRLVPPLDVLGRPALLVSPLGVAWAGIAIGLAALASVIHALP